jgi:Asp-tRNA(Asn)/Glu-tRNA(Gln) amidotransferase A subunit family amidase
LDFETYRRHDAVGLAALVAAREISPGALLETAVTAAERLDPAINALSQKLYDHGRAAIEAGLPGGPLAGVPFLLKDAGADLAGTPTMLGARILKDHIAEADSTLVARYKAAGLVIFGKTTTPEFALAASTETSLTGATRNPWDLARTAGGSSGGSGAAVAAGLVPAAHASDGGGSIRIPASCCGLFGLKPTRARTPTGPAAGEGWGSLAAAHVLTRSVRDSAVFLDAAQGAAPGDPYWAPPRALPYAQEVGADPGRLRIALQLAPPSGAAVDPECVAAAENAARLLEDLGHVVEPADLPGDWGPLGEAVWILVASNVSRTLEAIGAAQGRSIGSEDVDTVTWSAVEASRQMRVEDYPRALAAIHAQGRRMAAFHDRFDVVLSPTLGHPPPLLGVQRTDTDDLAEYREALAAFSPFTQMFNVTGQPSMSLPLHRTRGGLPVGVMISAGFGREDLLFRLAGQIEAAQPWFGQVARSAS